MRPATILIPLLGSLLAGCAYRTPETRVPDTFGGRARAVEVTLVDAEGREIAGESSTQVRADADAILARAGRGQFGPDAVVHARVELGFRYDLMRTVGRCGLSCAPVAFPVLAGMDMEEEARVVDVVVEAGGRTFVGHGEADKGGSLYARARKRALAVALDRALADAARTPL